MWAEELEPGADPPRSQEELLPLVPLDRATWDADEYPEAIVEGLLHRGNVTNTCGASKAGKGYNVLQRAACVATGTPFLGLGVRGAAVLYVSLEMPAAILRERLVAITSATGIPNAEIGSSDFQVIGGAPSLGVPIPTIDLTRDAGATQLRRTIERAQAEYVVLDTLYNALPGADINDNAEMALAFRRLRTVAQDTGAAIESLDHVPKGERLGPTSQAAVGAGVKGGAVATILELKRIRAGEGWTWEMHVDGWYGSWEQPLAYRRPTLPDGSLGFGCERTTQAEARGLSEEVVRGLFRNRGERDDGGRAFFASKRKLAEAARAEGLCGPSNDASARVVAAILADFAAPATAGGEWADARPIVTQHGTRNALVCTWREILA